MPFLAVVFPGVPCLATEFSDGHHAGGAFFLAFSNGGRRKGELWLPEPSAQEAGVSCNTNWVANRIMSRACFNWPHERLVIHLADRASLNWARRLKRHGHSERRRKRKKGANGHGSRRPSRHVSAIVALL